MVGKRRPEPVGGITTEHSTPSDECPECRAALRTFGGSVLTLTRSGAGAPPLIGPAVAGPEDDLRAVGGGGGVRVHAQPGLHPGDGAGGVDGPLLVRLAVAVPDDHRGAVG